MIEENIENIKNKIQALKQNFNIGYEIKIVPATKTVPPQIFSELLKYGITEIGENRTSELIEKFDKAKEFKWHFIGALQTNKVKDIIDKVVLIHSLDRNSLADEIEKQAAKINKIMEVLIEVNIGGEDTKSGVKPEEIEPLYNYAKKKSHIKIVGFMSVMPRFAEEKQYIKMREIFLKYKEEDAQITVLSVGMSDDYETAIKFGSNLVRLGRVLFGERKYI